MFLLALAAAFLSPCGVPDNGMAPSSGDCSWQRESYRLVELFASPTRPNEETLYVVTLEPTSKSGKIFKLSSSLSTSKISVEIISFKKEVVLKRLQTTKVSYIVTKRLLSERLVEEIHGEFRGVRSFVDKNNIISSVARSSYVPCFDRKMSSVYYVGADEATGRFLVDSDCSPNDAVTASVQKIETAFAT